VRVGVGGQWERLFSNRRGPRSGATPDVRAGFLIDPIYEILRER